MFKFIEGIEIAQLKILKHEEKIEYACYKDLKGVKKRKILGFEVLDDEEGVLLQLSATKVLCSKHSIDWLETAKLIKEDKVEKVIVKSWGDLKGYVICEDAYIVGEKHKRRSYGGCVFKVNSLESCVNIMNVLGGNFEYKEIEVIDTFSKFYEFLVRNKMGYNPNSICCFSSIKGEISRDVINAEKDYDVDLKILKED